MDLVLLLLLAAVALGVIGVRNLFGLMVLSGAYSFIMATLLVAMDAVDVGMTEAAVGAGVSTVLLLSALHLARTEEAPGRVFQPASAVLALVTGAALIYGTWDLPTYGDPDTPVHQHVAPYYIENTDEDIGIPNLVTAVLASYRGYDTLGEVTVIFAAGLGVMMLLHGRRRDKNKTTTTEKDDEA
ncbi:MAG: DUF4040 domain-containing protein [Rhodospirillaceae bacterium]